MHLSRLFLFLIAITVFLTVLQLFGYQVLELIIIIMVVDFLTVGAIMELGKRDGLIKNNPINIKADVVPRLEKIDNIEKTSKDILDQISNSNLENKLKKQSDDISYLLDKMAKKTLELEQRINKFGNGLLDSMSNLSKRVEGLEKTEEKKEEPEGQTFSLGELVYAEDDKKA